MNDIKWENNKSQFVESQTIDDFGAALHLMRSDLEHLRSVFMAVENGDLGTLKSIGIKDSELGDVKFFLEKLVKTGFLDWISIFLEHHSEGTRTLAVSYYNRTVLSLWMILWQVFFAK